LAGIGAADSVIRNLVRNFVGILVASFVGISIVTK
jgi:hypothetical protein